MVMVPLLVSVPDTVSCLFEARVSVPEVIVSVVAVKFSPIVAPAFALVLLSVKLPIVFEEGSKLIVPKFPIPKTDRDEFEVVFK